MIVFVSIAPSPRTPGTWTSWPGNEVPLGEVLSMVQGPDGPFLPGCTTAAQPRIRTCATLHGRLAREEMAQAVSACMRDALEAGWAWPKEDRQSWWGCWRDILAVGVYRHLETGQFIGILMTIEEARAAGASFPEASA